MTYFTELVGVSLNQVGLDVRWPSKVLALLLNHWQHRLNAVSFWLAGVCFCMMDGVCVLTCLSMVIQKERKWTGSDVYAVQSPSRERDREIRVPQPTSPAWGESATASPSKDRHTVISLFERKFLIVVFQWNLFLCEHSRMIILKVATKSFKAHR